MAALSRRLALLLPLALGACASADSQRYTHTVVSETRLVLIAIREELHRDLIPVDRSGYGSSRAGGGQVRSDPFDPAIVWRGEDLGARVACEDPAGKALAPVGRIQLRVSVAAEYRGEGPPGEPWERGNVISRATPHTQVTLYSSGFMTHEGGRSRCQLNEVYSKELLARIAARFPSAQPPRRAIAG